MNIESGSVHRDGGVQIPEAEGRLYTEAVVTPKGFPYLGFLGGGSARSRQIRNQGTFRITEKTEQSQNIKKDNKN
jgi:hypothetical protein